MSEVKKWVAIMIAVGSISACAPIDGELDEAVEEDEVELESIEQASTAKPLFGVHHWNGLRAPELVDAVGTWVGRPVELASAYAPATSWTAMVDLNWQLAPWKRWVAARAGRQFMFSVPMLPGPRNGAGPDGRLGTADDVSLAACAQGKYDQYWRAIGAGLVDHGLGNAIVRIGWEPDGTWFVWSAVNNQANYIGCFRKAVTAMRAARPAGKLRFDWSTSDDIIHLTKAQLLSAYPGDAFVDVMSVNAYDVSWVHNSYPIPASCTGTCAATRRTNAWNDMIRGVNMMRDLAKERGKLFGIPEWSLWRRTDGNGGGDNTDYVTRMHQYITNPSNRVYYHVYFDIDHDGVHQISPVAGNGTTGPTGNSHKTIFPLAAERFRALFRTP